jgi:hypothetical protein
MTSEQRVASMMQILEFRNQGFTIREFEYSDAVLQDFINKLYRKDNVEELRRYYESRIASLEDAIDSIRCNLDN